MLPIITIAHWCSRSMFRKSAFVVLLGTILIAYICYAFIYRLMTAHLAERNDIRRNVQRDLRTDGRWYNFSDTSRRLYIYSALYDDRPSLLSQPVVRLMAISDPINDMQHVVDNLYCILQYNGEFRTVRMTEHPKPIGFGWPLNGKPTNDYVFTCPTIEGKVPNTVSVSSNSSVDSSLCVPVIVPFKPIKRQDLGICVQAAYGTLDPHRLIEWFEVQKLIGVSFVGVYVLSASVLTLKVLNYYSNLGFVELHQMKYIYAPEHDPEKEFWLHLTPSINDCIYRHMYELDRILVIDFDEVVMPRMHRTLPRLVSFLDDTYAKRNSLQVNYVFRNNYFFLDFPSDDKISPHLTVLRFRKKVAVSPEGYSVKSIINPQACTHMHNHYCWGVTANYSRYDSDKSVDPTIAVLQHYKKCHLSVEECKDMVHNSTDDDTMMFLKEPLTENIRKMIRIIFNEEV